MDAWHRQAWLCYYLLQPHVKEGESMTPQQFDPYNQAPAQVTKIEFSELHSIW